jgi:tRNA modification GTPase
MGVKRTREKMTQASLIIYLFDVKSTSEGELIQDLEELKTLQAPLLVVGNKIGTREDSITNTFRNIDGIIYISAKANIGIEELKQKLLEIIQYDSFKQNDTLVTNMRHYESLRETRKALDEVLAGMDNDVPGDLLAQDIRQSLYHLGEITGDISTDDLLDNIFSKFCIGK